MESDSTQAAQEQLTSLSASRELALERIVLPWRYVIGFAVVANGCLLPVVLPIVLSDDWTMPIQGALVAVGVVLLLTLRRRPGVKHPRLRVQGASVLTAVGVVGSIGALAVGIYARSEDNPWLGAAALLINLAAWLVVYGAVGFLLRHRVARVARLT
ncbi:MAG: hypothetical protein ACJ72P_14660 [Nocardioides sp.]